MKKPTLARPKRRPASYYYRTRPDLVRRGWPLRVFCVRFLRGAIVDLRATAGDGRFEEAGSFSSIFGGNDSISEVREITRAEAMRLLRRGRRR
jgi:hypothetical protein